MPTIDQVLTDIQNQHLTLPAFQRGYVWRRPAVVRFFESLYHGYPVGSLLTWNTGSSQTTAGSGNLLLDGQQRMTTLYGVVKGKTPPFYRDDSQKFEHNCTGLYFRVDKPAFSFPTDNQLKRAKGLVSVTEVMQQGIGQVPAIASEIAEALEAPDQLATYMANLIQLIGILSRTLHIEKVSRTGGPALTLDDVVDIFNRTNSGGTKLKMGDLAMAEISIDWPTARDELREQCAVWQRKGREFGEDWLLMAFNVVATGEDQYDSLTKMSAQNLRAKFKETVALLDSVFNQVASRTGLDHTNVLIGHRAFYVMARYLYLHKSAPTQEEWDRLIYWYLQSAIWGRYIGASRANLARDLKALDDSKSGDMIRGLMKEFRTSHGRPRVTAAHFDAKRNSRFYAILYALVRMAKSQDWEQGVELTKLALGGAGQLELHHIFPQARLRKAGVSAERMNNLGNLAFLSKPTNQAIGDKLPAEYLTGYWEKQPKALVSQCVPSDGELWALDQYEAFLKARQRLLADLVNAVLSDLGQGKLEIGEEMSAEAAVVVVGGDSEEAQLDALREVDGGTRIAKGSDQL